MGEGEGWEGREGSERRGETLEGRGEEWRAGEERAPVSSLQHTTVRHPPSTSNYLHITKLTRNPTMDKVSWRRVCWYNQCVTR